MPRPILRDACGRVIRNLRISVTDRCNFRCIYCMPGEPRWLSREEVLTFEEIERLAGIAVSIGIEKIRLTGGEPTIRRDLPTLVRKLARIEGLRDFSITTNGSRLAELAGPLWEAGLRRINVSLDTLDEAKFADMTGGGAWRDVLAGIEEAQRRGFSPLKLNVVVARGHNDDEIGAFARLARRRSWQVRFIELMPLDGSAFWTREKVVTGREILEEVRAVAPLREAARGSGDPARAFEFADGRGSVGIIASVSEPFCAECDRIRLTAEGNLRTCLFSRSETPLGPLLRGGADDATIARVLVEAIRKKEAGQGLEELARPARAMYSIGG